MFRCIWSWQEYGEINFHTELSHFLAHCLCHFCLRQAIEQHKENQLGSSAVKSSNKRGDKVFSFSESVFLSRSPTVCNFVSASASVRACLQATLGRNRGLVGSAAPPWASRKPRARMRRFDRDRIHGLLCCTYWRELDFHRYSIRQWCWWIWHRIDTYDRQGFDFHRHTFRQ